MTRAARSVVGVLAALVWIGTVSAQNPVQWSGNARASIERARELSLPLMFWVDDRANDLDEDNLRDAQENAFHDPVVVWLSQHRFIPVRVSRNSRVLKEAAELGLPTEFGRYIALVSADGRVLDQIDPGAVAGAGTLAERLAAASKKYRDELYEKEYKPILTSKEEPKDRVRRAVQAVWQLSLLSADKDCVALLDRGDLTPTERGRLYGMLAALATKPCIDSLLSRAEKGERDAANALARAEAGALEWLIPEMAPADASERTARQSAAYLAVVQIARAGSARPDAFWKNAKVEDRAKELERLTRRAESVLDYWRENTGRWR